MATIDDNIAQLFELAEVALRRAEEQASRIAYLFPSINNGNLNHNVPDFTGSKPTPLSVFINDDTQDRLTFLDNEAEKWLNTYFPELQACLREEPEKWLCGIITGAQPFGMSEEYFRAIWLQARDREYRARNSATEQLYAEFSSRGFSIPPGALISAITQAERAAADAIGAVNIAQAIRDSEIKLDLLKFAEEQALALKRGILSSLADFYRAWIDLPNKAIEAERLRVAAYQALNSALSDYYKVELGWEELRLQAAHYRMNGKLDESRIRVNAGTGDSRNAAIGQAVNAFADIAAAASNAAGTLQANILSG